MKPIAFWILFGAACAAGCVSPSKVHRAPGAGWTSIGTAEMKLDRTIVLRLFAAPYAFPIGALITLIAGAPHDPPRTFQSIVSSSLVVGLILDVLMSLVPALFFAIARHSWPTEEKVIPEHLFGWPIGIAIVAGVSTCVLLMQEMSSLSSAWIVSISVLMTGCAAGCGLVAAYVWRRMTYRA